MVIYHKTLTSSIDNRVHGFKLPGVFLNPETNRPKCKYFNQYKLKFQDFDDNIMDVMANVVPHNYIAKASKPKQY